jgi:hypothetical protein
MARVKQSQAMHCLESQPVPAVERRLRPHYKDIVFDTADTQTRTGCERIDRMSASHIKGFLIGA